MARWLVYVVDPETEKEAVYQSTAPNEKAAETEARFAYTGLLGGSSLEKVRERLGVTVRRLD